jgi:NifU-like protein
MYSATVWHHYHQPQNRGPLEKANGEGKSIYRKCGDVFQLALQIEGDRIVRARFQARACIPVIAMGSVGTEMLQGLTVEQARQLLPMQLDLALDGLPSPKRHAILLFLEALHQALPPLNEGEIQS